MTLKAKLITCYLFNIIDLIATLFWVDLIGLDVEGNPFGRSMLSSPALTASIKIAGVGFALIVLYITRKSRLANVGATVLFTSYLVLTCYHALLFCVYAVSV